MSESAAAKSPIVPFRTWWTILRICLEERLVYRGDFALGTLMRFLPIVTQTFLWTAVFIGAGRPDEIAGFTRNEFIAYYLLTYVARAFSSMPGLASSIAAQVRTGEIKKYLVQPIDLLGFLFLVAAGSQARLLRRGDVALCLGVLPLSRLLRRLARCDDVAGFRRVARAWRSCSASFSKRRSA